MDEDSIEYGKAQGHEEAAEAIAKWLAVDEKWVAHVIEMRLLSHDGCTCVYDQELGDDFCETYKPLKEAELKERARVTQLNEAMDALHRAQRRVHDKMVAKYQEMGWLP